MAQYQMEGCEYIFTPSRKYAFFMSPFQSSLLNKAEDLFKDVTYTGNDFFYIPSQHGNFEQTNARV